MQKKNKLIEGDLPWNEKASRAGYMEIFAQVLPDFEANVNQIADGSIPDVSTLHPNAAAIYKLYRAGVVTGVDNKHNCNPMASIKRSEVSVILVRMMEKTSRELFVMSAEPSGGGVNPGNSGNTADSGGSNTGNTSTAKTAKALIITKQPNPYAVVKDYFDCTIEVEGKDIRYQWQEKDEKGNWKNLWDRERVQGSRKNKLSINYVGGSQIVEEYRCVLTDSGGALWDFATSNEVYTIIGQGTPKLMIDKTGDDEITFIVFSPGAKCEVRDEEGNFVEVEMEGIYPPLEL